MCRIPNLFIYQYQTSMQYMKCRIFINNILIVKPLSKRQRQFIVKTKIINYLILIEQY